MKATRKLLYVIGAVFTVRLVLLGCAPNIGVPSARPLSAGGSEVAIGGGLVGAEVPVAHIYYRRVSSLRPVEYGAVVNTNVGIGGFTRLNLCGNGQSPFTCGLQVDLGFTHAGLSLPISARVVEGVWVTTQPAFALSSYQYFRLPIGISMLLGDTGSMDATCGQIIDISTAPLTWYCGVSLGRVFGD